jgi:hypothetical protein
MKRLAAAGLVLGLVALAGPRQVEAQDAPELLAVGETAPNIQVEGATRYGVLAEPVNLNDLRGNTVVLAFFFRARTRG